MLLIGVTVKQPLEPQTDQLVTIKNAASHSPVLRRLGAQAPSRPSKLPSGTQPLKNLRKRSGRLICLQRLAVGQRPASYLHSFQRAGI